MLLPNQWSLRPAGQHTLTGDFPVNIAVHPTGKFAAILHCGFSQHEVVVIELTRGTVVSRAEVPEAFYGLTFTQDGRQIFCSGASGEEIFSWSIDKSGNLSARKNFKLRARGDRGVPCGLAMSASGQRLLAANVLGGTLSVVELTNGFIRDIALATNTLVGTPAMDKSEEDFDTAAVTKRAQAAKVTNADVNPFPYACAWDEKNCRAFVTLWNEATVAVVDLKTNGVAARWPVGQHPSELVLHKDRKFLFVANANDNTVTLLDTATGRPVETIWATLFANSPRGATPNSLALSPDGRTLFVANANINAVGVFDVTTPGKSRSLGFIPTGWYPTSVRLTPDGRQLLIANGKGNVAKANPRGPQPVRGRSTEEYIGKLLTGTLSRIDLPKGEKFSRQMADWTAQVLECTPLRPDAEVAAQRPAGNPIPARVGDASPIKYCIYVIKENRTYDQVFGDLPQGNGDPTLCLFPEKITPNHHRLATDFVLLDNFYVESEVSADGHEWSMAAYATDFVEKTWPINYGHKGTKFTFATEGILPVARPASGYLWDRALQAGVSYRSYGEFVQNAAQADQPATTRIKNLEGHFDPWFRSFDMEYPDRKRADRFISELKRFEDEGEMPRLQIVRLPNDHTQGTRVGKLTPTAHLAEHDAALGQLVAAVSRSKFWSQTAIFVVEDDAQNGPDHVDAHRTVALCISPFTRNRGVDSTMYSTSSMLRTMELILGLQPMTQFDAAATPMFNSFHTVADLWPYEAISPQVDLTETNTLASWGSNENFNYAKEDANDDLKFNEVIWRSVKGADHPMPAPVRAGFVLARPVDED